MVTKDKKKKIKMPWIVPGRKNNCEDFCIGCSDSFSNMYYMCPCIYEEDHIEQVFIINFYYLMVCYNLVYFLYFQEHVA